ncbi:MAG TPA: hypothetical protein VHA75_08030 [Rugosimonospora sp.]|nr:hypothetical protein [Rugosimonospora sp.]
MTAVRSESVRIPLGVRAEGYPEPFDRVRASVVAAVVRRTTRREVRAELDHRRAYGLARRHQAKLARTDP